MFGDVSLSFPTKSMLLIAIIYILAKITTEIEKMESSLKEMKKAKKELEEQIRQARLSELDELIQEKGLTFDELKEMLIKKDSE